MNQTTTKERFLFIDYLRAYMIILVVLEHSLLPYAPHFKKTAYISDFGGGVFFDIFHYHNDAIMMPFLFLLAGMFVFPSLQRRGFLDFCREKFLRLVVPFVLGIAILVPPQTYPKYLLKTDSSIGYLDYLQNVFFFGGMSASGFWFLYYLFVLTFALIFISYLLPGFVAACGRFTTWLIEKPIRGFCVFFLISALILGVSDLIWGPFYWVGFGEVFYVRGSRFLVKIFFFLMGAGIAQAGLTFNKAFLVHLSESWLKWVLGACVAGACYMGYSLTYFEEGAYNFDFLLFLHSNESWDMGWPILREHALLVLMRTTLLGLFMCSLTVMYFALFYRFLNKESVVWASLAASSFGIYIFHEPIQVWMTYAFYQADVSEYIKFIVTASVALGISWFVVQKVLLKTPGFKRIL
jgi:glucan biosynthesis protein C